MNWMKRSAVAAVLAGTMVTVQAATPSEDGWLKPSGSAFETVTVKKQEIKTITGVQASVVHPVYRLSFAIGGTIEKCMASVGERVQKYDSVMKLSEVDGQKKLDSILAEADRMIQKQAFVNTIYNMQTKQMKTTYAALQAKVNNGSATAQDRMQKELLDLQLPQREKEYDAMLSKEFDEREKIYNRYDENNGSMTKNYIVSPCDGVVVSSFYVPGNSVSDSQEVIAIMDDSVRYIEVPGMEVWSEQDREKYDSVCAYVDGEAYPLTYMEDSFSVFGYNGMTYFEIPEALQNVELRSISVGIVEKKTEPVIAVPLCTVYRNGSQRYVYRMEDGIREMVEIMCGDDNGSMVEVLGGELQEGDVIYVP